MVVCCWWLDLLSLLGAADLVTVAWPVNGILAGQAHVRGGQRSSIRCRPACDLYCNRDS